MTPFPYTKVLGAIACVAGVVTKACETKYPTVSWWAHLVFMCCAALGIFMARNNGTTSEQAGLNPIQSRFVPDAALMEKAIAQFKPGNQPPLQRPAVPPVNPAA